MLPAINTGNSAMNIRTLIAPLFCHVYSENYDSENNDCNDVFHRRSFFNSSTIFGSRKRSTCRPKSKSCYVLARTP